VFNFAKIRASYGTTGNDNIADYSYLGTYNTNVLNGSDPTITLDGLYNPDLQWETITKKELGIDLQFFDGKISLSNSVFGTKGTDLLLDIPITGAAGHKTRIINSEGITTGWGYETTLNTINISNENFTWDTNFNFSLARTKLVYYPNDELIYSTDWQVGSSLDLHWFYRFRGVDPQTGDATFWRDINSNGLEDSGEIAPWNGANGSDILDFSDPDDISLLDTAPSYYGGIGNHLRYKNFNLDFFFSFKRSYVRTPHALLVLDGGIGGINQNIPKSIYDARWQSPGDVTGIPRFAVEGSPAYLSNIFNYSSSTASRELLTYARLESVNLSFSVPNKWLDLFKIKSMNLYLQGQNLLLLSKKYDYDPDTYNSAIGPTRTFLFGTNITF